jgi:hypothetical protein
MDYEAFPTEDSQKASGTFSYSEGGKIALPPLDGEERQTSALERDSVKTHNADRYPCGKGYSGI